MKLVTEQLSKYRIKHILTRHSFSGNLKQLPFRLANKSNLTIKEAAAYSNIGINRIEELLKQPECNFVLYVGNKKLVKSKEFEKYVSENLEL